MGNYDDRNEPGGPARHRLRAGWLVLAVVVALLVGLGGGYLLWNSTAEKTQAVPSTSTPAATSTTAPPPPAAASCVGVADAGAKLLAQLQDAIKAIGNLDPQALEQVLNRIQQLQGVVQRAVTGCRDQFGGAVPSLSATPSP